MPPLYRDTGYTLNYLIEDIKTGRIALPDIQRPFVWSSAKVRDLFDSMYRGYPIGTLMLWETGADAGTRGIGLENGDRTPQLLIVDGQQRLTSLFAVITGRSVLTKSFDEKRIRIAFRPEDEAFEVTDAAIERDPEFIPDITALWSEGYRPTARAFLKRLAETRPDSLTDDEADILDQRINRVHDLGDFRFQVVELSEGADEEQVAEIFVRINSEGVQLNQADFILTLMSVHWERGRRDLEAFSRAAVDPAAPDPSPRNPFIDPAPDQMLRVAVAVAFRRGRLSHVYNLLRGKDLETGDVDAERRKAQFEALAQAHERVLDLTNWHEFLKCLQTAGFRSRRMITSENAILYSYVLWLIGRLDFGIAPQDLRPLIARWFFMSHTTGRYTSSPESQIEADLSRLRDLDRSAPDSFVAELDRTVRANFTNDYWAITLPNRLDTSGGRSPVLFAYLAALNLLDAEALFSDVKVRDLLDPSTAAPREIERHHLFPRKYLESIGVTGIRTRDAIANMAYLDWLDNSDISKSPPAEYWPVMSARVSADRLARQVHLHALPPDWQGLDYPEFLEQRRTRIATIVREGFDTLWGGGQPDEPTPAEIIAEGESHTVEFKATARWNTKTQQPDPAMGDMIVKTICGFLNGEGGSLFVGVDDDGVPLGLDDDFKTLGSKGDKDGFELHLRDLLEGRLSTTTARSVAIRFPEVDGTTICWVAVAASSKPIFAVPGKGQPKESREFWVRMGNQTRQLHGDDLVFYEKEHWG